MIIIFLGPAHPFGGGKALAQRLDLLLNRSLMYPTHTQQIFRRVIVKFQLALISMM